MGFLSGYSRRKSITIDNTTVDGDLTDVPVLVVIDADADIGALALANGHDIRFTLDDGTTLLNYDRQAWAISSGEASGRFRVLVPNVDSAAPTTIYVYYGDSGASDGSSTSAYPASWEAYWPLDESPANSAPQMLDRTANGWDGTYAGSMTSGDSVAAVIGDGVEFDGSDDRVATSYPGESGDYTIKLWINPTSLNFTAGIIQLVALCVNNNAPGQGLALFNYAVGPNYKLWSRHGTGPSDVISDPISLTVGTPTLIEVSYVAATKSVSFFQDGSAVGSGTHSANLNTGGTLTLARNDRLGGSPTQYYNGIIDDVVFASAAGSPDLAKFRFYNESSVDNELTFSTEQDNSETLVVADGTVQATGDSIVLTQTHVLTVADGTVAATTEQLTLSENPTLTVADGTVQAAGDNIDLAQTHVLIAADGTVSATGTAIALVQTHVLSAADGTVAAVSDSPTLSTITTLDVHDGSVAATGESITITQTHVLAAADGIVSSVGDAVVLTEAGLAVAGPFVVVACQVRAAGADKADWYGSGAEVRRVYAAGSEAAEVLEGVQSCGCH